MAHILIESTVVYYVWLYPNFRRAAKSRTNFKFRLLYAVRDFIPSAMKNNLGNDHRQHRITKWKRLGLERERERERERDSPGEIQHGRRTTDGCNVRD